MGLLPAAVVALVALIITPGYLFYFDVTPKVVVLLAGTGALLLVVAISGTRIAPRSRWLAVLSALLLLNLISLLVSTVLSTRHDLSPFGTNWRRYGSVIQAVVCVFAWLVAVSCAGRPVRVRVVFWGVAVAGAISALYGIAQYFGVDPLLPAAAYHVGEGFWTIVRPPGTLGYASYFATWLLFVVFLSLGLSAMEPSRVLRRAATAVAILATCAMLLTGTRAALLGLAVGGLVWMAVRKVHIPRCAVAVAALVIAAGAVFYYTPPGQQMRSRSRWFAEDPWGGARGKLWRDSIRMASHRLGAGFGPEVFTAEFPQFESADLASAYPDFAHESPHNMFLDALVSQGIPGLLLLIALCATGLAAAFRLKQPALAAALVAIVVSQQFTAFTVPTALAYFVTLGLLAAIGTAAAAPRRRLPLVAGAAVPAAVLLYLAARLTISDHALALAKRALDNGNLPDAAAQYGKYANFRLPGGSSDLWYSRALLSLAARPAGLAVRISAARESGVAAVNATATAEDPFNAWYNLAVVCGSQDNGACAERSLRSAIQAHPNWFKPHWMLARILLLEGRRQEAQREAALAVQFDGGKNPEVNPQPFQE